MKTIVAAAILGPDGKVWSLPQPNRHHNIIWQMHGEGVATDGDQGFITNDNEYVDRIEAGKIALDAGQTDRLKWGPSLYSEDLW